MGGPEARADLQHLFAELLPLQRERHELLAHVLLPGLAVAVPVVQAVQVATPAASRAWSQSVDVLDSHHPPLLERGDLVVQHGVHLQAALPAPDVVPQPDRHAIAGIDERLR